MQEMHTVQALEPEGKNIWHGWLSILKTNRLDWVMVESSGLI